MTKGYDLPELNGGDGKEGLPGSVTATRQGAATDAQPSAAEVRKYRLALATLYERTEAKAWEPRVHTNPFIEWAIGEGFLRRVDGRCGFEAFKDSMLAWTEAAHMALGLTSADARDSASPSGPDALPRDHFNPSSGG